MNEVNGVSCLVAPSGLIVRQNENVALSVPTAETGFIAANLDVRDIEDS